MKALMKLKPQAGAAQRSRSSSNAAASRPPCAGEGRPIDPPPLRGGPAASGAVWTARLFLAASAWVLRIIAIWQMRLGSGPALLHPRRLKQTSFQGWGISRSSAHAGQRQKTWLVVGHNGCSQSGGTIPQRQYSGSIGLWFHAKQWEGIQFSHSNFGGKNHCLK